VSRLFIDLYLDEDVDVLVASLVRARGFAASTTQEARQPDKNDAEQLAYESVSTRHCSRTTARTLRPWPNNTLKQGKGIVALSLPCDARHTRLSDSC
jgi:hypothetical protein